MKFLPLTLAALLTPVLFMSTLAANADIDADSFPAELRSLDWREVGPYRGGRADAVAGVPTDRNTYYMGATGGGVWKTSNGGASWENVSDGYFGGSVGAVAISEWDANVVYVGLGEKTIRGNVSPGDGAWRSTDAGTSWTRIGLQDSQHISRIRIHPRDPELVYAAVMGHLFGPNKERGVFRSKDGGDSWEQVLFVNDRVGAVDLVLDPTNPRILYASFWNIKRTPYSLESGGEGSGLYKSVDGGDTWALLSDNDGFPEAPLGIIGIAVSPTNNKNVYAMVEADEGGLLRSKDGGETWVRVNEDRNLRQRAWYYTRIYADPVDEESLYVLNVRFHYSKDGGKRFTEIDTPHSDNHDLWIDPQDPLRMIEANDGGVNVSVDRGKTWSTQSNQPTAQMYRVSTDNAFPYRLLGGQQDNSAVRIRSRSATGNVIGRRDWEPTAGGESGHIVAKPDDPDIVVGGSYGGFLRVIDHRTGLQRGIDVWPDNPMGWAAADIRHRFQWNYPIAFSTHNSDRLFVAAEKLFRSDDLGQSWTAISPDLTRNDKSRMGPSGGPITRDNTSIEYYGTIFALAESQHEAGVIWAGSDDGRVNLTRDGGTNWIDVTPKRLPEWAQINSIEIDPFEPGGAYLAATRYKSDDFTPYLYKTSNWGRSWTRINRGIPDNEFTRVVRADPVRRGLLFAGTERGLYHSLDDGRSWTSLQLDLPVVPITDLAIKGDDLIAATQGRGYWILDDLAVLRQLDPAAQGTKLYTPGLTYRLSAGGRAENPGAAGTNPHTGVVIYYALDAEPDADTTVELSVFEADSETPIWTWTQTPVEKEDEAAGPNDPPETRVLPTDIGLNKHVWDLRYPGMTRFDDLIMWADMKAGPRAVPGRYRARLKVGDVTQEVNFDVQQDPRSNSTLDDYKAQFTFVVQARDLLSQTHAEITRIRAMREQLERLQTRLASSKESTAEGENLDETINTLLSAMTKIEEALYQTKNESQQDPLNYPIRLNNKLTSLMRSVAAGDAKPTDQAHEVKAELTATIEAHLNDLATLWMKDLPALQAKVGSLGLSLLVLPALNTKESDTK
ncbi:MAG: photosystem II stability/assembly factor-like uncharacterized protein [Candidatus Azotimanducaceae bacterium]|jgi:photosystem II stability/assembly factor-like uncharacterized protein